MISSSWDRSRRIRTAAAVLTVIATTIGVLALALGAGTVGVPEGWWPHTGQAFTSSSPPAHDEPCRRIVGEAKKYCERGTTRATTAEHHSKTAAVWRLLSAGAGLSALIVWWRHAARQRRR